MPVSCWNNRQLREATARQYTAVRKACCIKHVPYWSLFPSPHPSVYCLFYCLQPCYERWYMSSPQHSPYCLLHQVPNGHVATLITKFSQCIKQCDSQLPHSRSMTPTLSVGCLAQVSFHNNKQLTYTHSIIFPSLINTKSWQRTTTVTAIMRDIFLFFIATIVQSPQSNFLGDFLHNKQKKSQFIK